MTDRETITLDKQLFDQALEHLRPGTSAGPEGVPYAVGLLTASAALAQPAAHSRGEFAAMERTWQLWKNEAERLSAAIESAGFGCSQAPDGTTQLVRRPLKATPWPLENTDIHGK